MGVLVAGGAQLIEPAEPDCRSGTSGETTLSCDVALGALYGTVLAVEKLTTRPVRVTGELEGLAPVTRLTTIAELSEVDVLVARLTRGLDAVVQDRGAFSGREHAGLQLMTFGALDGRVFACEGE
jgi:hypothetical protein